MNNNDYKNKLRNYTENSALSKEQKMLWQLFLKISNDDEDEAVYEAVKENDDNLNLLTKYLRDKIWDMKENDPDSWRRLIDDQEKYANLLA